MATGTQIENLTYDLAQQKPKQARDRVKANLQGLGGALIELAGTKATLDVVVADAAAASSPDYQLTQVQADWGSNLAAVVNAGWSYDSKSGISAIAQLIADLSEQAGLEGTANEIRIYKNGALVAVSQDA